jgi:hypothetical protein
MVSGDGPEPNGQAGPFRTTKTSKSANFFNEAEPGGAPRNAAQDYTLNLK